MSQHRPGFSLLRICFAYCDNRCRPLPKWMLETTMTYRRPYGGGGGGRHHGGRKSAGAPEPDIKNLLSYSAREIAEQLTLMLYNGIYRQIRPCDLVTKAGRARSGDVVNMVRYFDICSWWTLSEVLDDLTPAAERLQLVFRFLDVAFECRKLNNYHTMFAIAGGLLQPMLNWIWRDKQLVNKEQKQRLNDLKRKTSHRENYRVYQADMSFCRGRKPNIPYLGVTTKVLLPLEDFNAPLHPAYPELVNFGRCRQAVVEADAFLQGQRHRCKAKGCGTYEEHHGIDADDDLQLLIAYGMSERRPLARIKELSRQMQEDLHEAIVKSLEESGFLW